MLAVIKRKKFISRSPTSEWAWKLIVQGIDELGRMLYIAHRRNGCKEARKCSDLESWKVYATLKVLVWYLGVTRWFGIACMRYVKLVKA
ncbi:predicted protein [Botrytis cinerea T4]|uniref:Uncharacterized protein n=1 Tax=Botryotinia fuckeliana (strain T4) TaxID=999810 RepID=G2XST9_BOTF4|nr:predicted protein [Botrytis cinerea T4]